MEEIGKVVKLDKNHAVVRFNRKSSCANCGMCGFKKNDTHVDLRVKNTLNANENDEVVIKMQDSGVLLSSIIVYLIPVVFLFLGILVGSFIFEQMWAQFTFALGLVVVSFLVIFLLDKKFKYTKKFSPEMVEIHKKETDEKE